MDNIFELNIANKKELIDRCSACLLKQQGSFLLLPTETVYGLMCSWDDKNGRESIYMAKERSRGKPFQLLVSDIKMLRMTNAVISKQVEQVISAFCPGPITIIVPKKDSTEKIGFRIPKHEFILELIQKMNKPLAATSANISGAPPALDVYTALKDLNRVPDLAVNGGCLPSNSIASTVVELANDEVKIIREGIVTYSEIKKVVNS